MVQQQMRNTHFGDSGFGLSRKLKGDFSVDSERKMSRRRGSKKTNNVNQQNQDNGVRDSTKLAQNNNECIAAPSLNRSINMQQSQINSQY